MSTVLLRTAVRLIFPLTLIYAVYTALKGHNEPGGGFIGGLMASVAFILFRMTYGRRSLITMLPFHPRLLVSVGLTLALATAVTPLLFGRPLLTSKIWDAFPVGIDTIHLASAVFFDTGVLMVVVGVSVGMIQRLSEEIDAREARKS